METEFDKARELAEMLLDSAQGKKMTDARYIFESDEDAKAQLLNYTNYMQAVQMRVGEGNLSQEEINKESDKLREMRSKLQENPVINDMVAAESDFNMFVNHVMSVFQATLQGDPEGGDGGCTGSCSTCGGCH